MNIQEIRQKYPQYNDLSDGDLSQRLYNKYYADKLSYDDFSQKIGLPKVATPQEPTLSQPTPQNIVEAKAQQMASNSPYIPILDDLAQPAKELGTGGVQLLAQGISGLTGWDAPKEWADEQAQIQRRAYEMRRDQSSVPEAITKGAEFAGNFIAPSGVVGNIGKGIKGAVATGALGGAIGGALQPIYGGDFAKEKLGQVATGGAVGGALGGVAGGIGKGIDFVRDLKRPNAPIKTSQDVKDLSNKVYSLAEQQGARISPNETNALIDKVSSLGRKSNLGMAVEGSGQAEKVKSALQGFKDKDLNFKDIEEFDQAITGMINDNYTITGMSSEGYKLQQIQDEFRDWVDNLDFKGNEKEGLQTLKTAKALWSQAMKIRDVENILTRAENMEQPTTAIKTGFRQILGNKKRLRGYTPDEKKALERASKTGNLLDVVRVLGSRLNPIGAMVGGGLGQAGASFVGSSLARGLGTKIQTNKALDVANLVASRNINVPKNIDTKILDNQIQGLTEEIKSLGVSKPIPASTVNQEYSPSFDEINPDEAFPNINNIAKNNDLKTYSGYTPEQASNIVRKKTNPDGGKYFKNPIIRHLMDVGVEYNSPIGKELRALGITPQTAVGLFRKGGYKEFDNVGIEDFRQFGVKSDDTGAYVDRNDLIEKIRDEMGGLTPRDKKVQELEDDLMFLGLSKKATKKEIQGRLSENEGKRKYAEYVSSESGQKQPEYGEDYLNDLLSKLEVTKKDIGGSNATDAQKRIRLINIRNALVREKKNLKKSSPQGYNLPVTKRADFSGAIPAIAGGASRLATQDTTSQPQASMQDESVDEEFNQILKEYNNKNTDDEFQNILNEYNGRQGQSMNSFADKVKMAESSGNPNAQSKTSSAKGLYGFTDSTWDSAVNKWGRDLGVKKSDRNNLEAQTALFLKLTEDNAQRGEKIIGRSLDNGEKYVLHFMGAGAGSKLIKLADKNPNALAKNIFPKEAEANKSIFYNKGKPRTLAEVTKILKNKVA